MNKTIPALGVRSALLFAMTLASVVLLGACSESNNADDSCTVTSECEAGELCHAGVCQSSEVPRACTGATDCIGGEGCVLGYCAMEDVSTPDTSVPDTFEPADVVDASDVPVEPDVLDITAPIVVSHTPAADATGVALNTTVTATFNEVMIGASVIDTRNFYVKDSNNRTVPGTVTYDEVSFTVTLTFSEALWPWTSYRATLTSAVMDRAQNPLVEYSWDFSTTAPPAQAFYEELARAYAPIIKQDAHDVKIDVPVRIDFDNDLQPYNNANNMNSGVFDPAAYFNVTETDSHYFIQYLFYYPVYMPNTSPGSGIEHTVNGMTSVIAKDGTRLGHIALFQTHSSGFSDGRVDTFVPRCDVGSTEPFCPHGYTKRAGGVNSYYHEIDAAAFADATEHRRVNLYVAPYNHEICHFASSGEGNIYCTHTPDAYQMTKYADLTLNPSMTATPTAADFVTTHVGTYQLYPLAEPWWTHRSSMSSSDTTAFYRSDYAYSAPNAQQPSVTGLRLPNALSTDQQSANTGMFSPWGWSATDGFGVDRGVFTVDPAFAVQARLVAPAEFTFKAANYCFNAFLGIDRTQTDDICKPVP